MDNGERQVTKPDSTPTGSTSPGGYPQHPKTPGALNRTMTTEASPSTSIHSVRSTPTVDTSISNASTSSSSTRIPLPSPHRPRLDPQYAARLAPRNLSQQQQLSSQSNPMIPPAIRRSSDNQSIFRPTPILTLGQAAPSSSGSGSFVLESPDRAATRSMSYSSISSANSGGHTQGSFSSANTPRRSYTTRYRSDVGQADRFIPSRATSNFSFSLWDDSPERPTATTAASTPTIEGESNESNSGDDSNGADDDNGGETSASRNNAATNSTQQPSMLNALLRSELLGENVDPAAPGNVAVPYQSRNTAGGPLREGGNYFQFQSPRQAYHSAVLDQLSPTGAVVDSFNLTPIGSAASKRLMSTPQKRQRRIQKVPFKVLDAPALQDDFYLNLVDWSSQNVLAVGLGSCVYLWSACTSKVTKLCDLAPAEDIVTSVAWAQRGNHLAVGTNRGEVQLWDTVKCKKVRTMGGHSARVGTLNFSGASLASGSRDRLIYLRDVRAQAPYTHRLAAHKQEVCGLKFSFDEPASLASGGNDNKLLVWDIKNPSQPVSKFSEHSAAVKAIAWSPHQHGLLASGGGTADRCIRFWNTLSGVGLHHIDTGSQVCNLAWSKNCNEIVSTHGYSLNQIVVWRYPSMSKVVTLTGHTFRVLYLAMSPDGSTIVTGAGDETLRFWQLFPGPRSHDKSSANGLLFPAMPGSVIR